VGRKKLWWGVEGEKKRGDIGGEVDKNPPFPSEVNKGGGLPNNPKILESSVLP
jgi:hypothetical protein